MERDKSLEDKFNRFSREPVYGEGVVTLHEQAEILQGLQDSLDRGDSISIGAGIVGAEIDAATKSIIESLHQDERLGASLFSGKYTSIITEDGGILVIGDGCLIKDTQIRVLEGATLLIEDAVLLESEIVIESGEHKIVKTRLARCIFLNSTLQGSEAKESTIKNSLLRDIRFLHSSVTNCIGSSGGAEIGGVYQNKSFSYFMDPVTYRITFNVENLET